MSERDDTGPAGRCPSCGRALPGEGADARRFFPFCSERCKLIDLGKWLEGEHRIEEPLSDRVLRGEHAEGADNGKEPRS